MRCFKCGKELPLDSKFCQYCGNDLSQNNFCSICGAELRDNVKFCSMCGTAIPEAFIAAEKFEPHDVESACKTGDNLLTKNEPVSEAIPEENCGVTILVEEKHGEDLDATVIQPAKKKSKRFKWPIIIIGCLFIAVCLAVVYSNNKAPEAVEITDAANSVLYLEMFDASDDLVGTASGFFVSDQETLVTNFHVIADAYHIVAYTEDGTASTDVSTILVYDEAADLAILKCDDELPVNPLILADSDKARQGDKIYAVGYPLGIANTLSDGIISSRYIDNGVDLLQITAPISGGSSGGALINESGHVVGVICAYFIDGQNMNLAIASNVVSAMLEEHGAEQRLKYFYWNTHAEDEVSTPLPEVVPQEPETSSEVTPIQQPTPSNAPEVVSPTPTPTPERPPEPVPSKEPQVIPQDPKPIVTEIRLTHDFYYLKDGETLTLEAVDVHTGNQVTDITWAVIGDDRISVQNGLVVQLEGGWTQCTVIAETSDGIRGKCDLIEDNTYSGLVTKSAAGNAYSRYPSILSIDNVLTAHFWHEFEISYPQWDIYAYNYVYQTATLEEAEKCVATYAKYLQEHGYTLIRMVDNPQITQSIGNDPLYELVSPDHKYTITLTTSYFWTYWVDDVRHARYDYQISIEKYSG